MNNRFPLSYAQSGQWFLYTLDPTTSAYNVNFLIPLPSDANVLQVKQSLAHISERHEILRTVYGVSAEGQPYQEILDETVVEMDVCDWRPLLKSHEEVVFNFHLFYDAPFDLQHGPIWRARLHLCADESILQVVAHHIAADEWSGGILAKEINYYCAGHSLPELPLQYADFALWQQEVPLEQSALVYWQEQLKGLPALSLPPNHTHSPGEIFGGKRWVVDLPQAQQILAQIKKTGMTPTTWFLTAAKALLYLHTGQTDFAVGVPVAYRPVEETEGMIGMFVNTLPIRSSWQADMTLAEALTSVGQTMLDAYACHAPLEAIVQAVNPTRQAGQNPLYQVLFGYHEDNNQLWQLPLSPNTARLDLALAVQLAGDTLKIIVECRDTIHLPPFFVAHLQKLIEIMAKPPRTSLQDICLTVPGEEHQIMQWNQTEVTYSHRNWLLHHFLEHQATITPDAIALQDDQGNSLTYQELDQLANRLAHYLVEHGVGPERLVAVYMDRSFEMMVALFGILKAGGAYIPIDPLYPQERVIFMLQESQALLLTQTHLQHQAPAPALVVNLKDLGAYSNSPVAVDVSPHNLAYVIYTSGSTGKPKGVAVEHQAIVNRLLWAQSQYPLFPDDAIMQKTPTTFDVSVWELFAPFMAGARLVIARPEGHKDPLYMAELAKSQGVTVMHFVPSMLRIFLEDRTAVANLCASKVRRVHCSGEALSTAIRDRFFAEMAGVELLNLYGPTECAVDVTHHLCAPSCPVSVVPIGHPIANTQMYILDSQLRMAPIGVTGELFIGGLNVARGYVNRPELTSERFLSTPYGRLYRTGDLARYMDNGEIEFLGRNDFQVKVRGMRIELGEIEASIEAHDMVHQAVVVAKGRGDDVNLVAYVICDEGLPEVVLRQFLAQHLPEYMIPASFVFMGEFPLTTSGKVDRKALPELDRGVSSHETTPAQTPTEIRLEALWLQMLDVPHLGRESHFFQVGGNSLMAAVLASRIRDAFAIHMAVSDVFRYSTLEAMARQIDVLSSSVGWTEGEI